MKPLVLVGVLLVIFGIVALAYQGISYTTEETVLDIGPLEAKTETEETIPIPPILGGAAVLGGLVLVVAGMKK